MLSLPSAARLRISRASRGGILFVVLGVVFVTSGPVAAQDLSSVIVEPAGTSEDDPNQGGWFVLEVDPGGESTGVAAITNPARSAQEVRLEIRDLEFGEDGTERLPSGADEGIGLWGAFERQSIRIPAGQTQLASFLIRVPVDAEPGDHIGAVVASTTNVQDGVDVTRQIATRLYVTVPGEADRALRIDEVDVSYDSRWWPRRAEVTVRLVNEGRIRIRPRVTVSGREALGPEVLLTRAAEDYLVDREVPWYGGVLRLPVQAVADGGITRSVNTSRFVMPWGLVLVILTAIALTLLGMRWQRARGSATAELRSDIQRLERLVTQRAEPTAQLTEPDLDEEAVLAAAIQRARRTHDHVGLGRAALILHGTTGEALDLLLEAFAVDEGKHREALLTAIAGYDAAKVTAHPGFALLSDDEAAVVRERLQPPAETSRSAAKKSPAKKAPAKRRPARKPAAGAHKRTAAKKATKKAAPKKPKKDD